MPPGPMTLTRRGRRSRPVAWNRSLSRRSSSSRPTNGASRASLRLRPPRSATTRRARQAGTGAAFPLSACSPAGSKAIARDAARSVASPTSTVPGAATDWSREAVLTMSPATIPWLVAPEGDRRLAGEDPGTGLRSRGPARGRRPRSSSAARTARSASSSCAMGAPQTAMTASPMNFSTVPPYRPITSAREVEVPRQRLAHLLRVALLGERREAHEVGEQDATPAGARRRARGCRMACAPGRRVPRHGRPRAGRARTSGVAHSPQNLAPGGLAVPHAGHEAESGVAHSVQNLRPASFSVPQLEQVMTARTSGSRFAQRERCLRIRGGLRVCQRRTAPAFPANGSPAAACRP